MFERVSPSHRAWPGKRFSMSNRHPSSRAGTYFQIPLCALAYGRSDKERLEAIICFGLVEAGQKRWMLLAGPQRQALLNTLMQAGKIPIDFRRHEERHVFALLGADILKITLPSVSYALVIHDELVAFRDSFERRYGKDPLVRLKTELVFEARNGTGITPRELSVLAAIFSIVGKKQAPVRITQARVRHRALGYKTQAVCEKEISRRRDCAKPLTEWQLRSLIECLHTRKFFARTTFGRRLTFYSHRMTDAQLRNAVIEMKTFRCSNRLLARHDDAAMTDAIRNYRAATLGKPPPAPNARPFRQPGGIGSEDIF